MDEAPEGEPKKPGPRGAHLAGAAGLTLAVAIGGVWFFRLPLAEMALRQALSGSGVEADLDLRRLDFAGAAVRSLRLGDLNAPDFTAEEARIGFSWGFGPRIAALELKNATLRARIDEKGLSLGQLDALTRRPPSGKPPKLPDWAVEAENARLLVDMPLGLVTLKGEAHGRVREDFNAVLAAAPADLIGPEGGIEALAARLTATTRDGVLSAVLESDAETVAWRAKTGGEISGLTLSADARLPVDLSRADARATLKAREAALGDISLAGLTAEAGLQSGPLGPGFLPNLWTATAALNLDAASAPQGGGETARLTLSAQGDRERAGGEYALTLDRGAFAGFTARAPMTKGAFAADYSGEAARIGISGGLKAGDAAFDARARRDLLAAVPSLGGTPLAPLMDATKPALDRALAAFSIEAPFSISWTSGHGRITAPNDVTLQAKSGAKIVLADIAGDAPPLALSVPSGAMDGGARITMNGGGLPDAALAIGKIAGGGGEPLSASGTVSVRSWAANGASFEAAPIRVNLTLDAKRSQARVVGEAKLTGPFAGVRLVDARVPIEIAARWGESLRIEPANQACAAIDAQRIEAPGLTFDAATVNICPADGGAFAVTDMQGLLGGGFVIDGLDLKGHIAGEPDQPAHLRTGRIAGALTGAPDRIALLTHVAAPDLTMDFSPERQLHVRGASASALLRTGGSRWSLKGDFTKGALDDPALPARVTDIEAKWSGGPTPGGAVFTLDDAAARVFDPADRPMLHPIRVSGVTGLMRDGIITGEGLVSLERDSIPLGRFTAKHDLESGVGQATLMARDLTFSPELQPYYITELARGVIDNVRGPVDADIVADWTRADVKLTGRAAIKDVSLATASLGVIEGVTGDIVFDDLTTFSTPPYQYLAVRRLNPGVPVENGVIGFQLKPNSVIVVENARWPFAGGMLEVEPATIELAGEETRLSLSLTDVDVQTLTRQFNFKGFSATGQVEGRFPLIFTKKGGRIEGGRLHTAAGGGVITYTGDVGATSGPARLAFDALRSFRYDDLALELDGDLDGEIVTAIVFSGENSEPVNPAGDSPLPVRAVGIPFKFNVTVRAPFFALARNAASFTDAREILDNAKPKVDVEMKPPADPDS